MFRLKQLSALVRTTLVLASFQLTAWAVPHDVRVVDHEFDPPIITIAPGDTVKWTAYGNDHTVTADDGSFDSAVALPEPAIPLFGSYSVTFNSTGVFQYYCQVHGGPGMIGMSGKVRVIVPGANVAPTTPTNTSPVNGAMGVSKTPLLQASAFSDSDDGDAHTASQWLVRKTADGSVILDTGVDADDLTNLRPEGLENGIEYGWSVRYRDAAGAWSEYSAETKFTTVSGITTAGTGLTAMYGSYNKKTKAVTINGESEGGETIDFDWSLGKPNKLAPANFLYAMWEGTIVPPTSEEYLFRVIADGGVKLVINGQVVIDDWMDGKFPVYRGGAISLEAGVPATIKVEYYDSTGKASIKLRWVTPTRPLEVIPQAVLYPLNN